MSAKGASTGWKRWRRLWKGWVVIPTGIGVSVFTVLQWRKIGNENAKVNNFQITCYRAVPFRALSRAWGWLSSCYVPVNLRGWLYTRYAKFFGVNIEEAAFSLRHYDTLCDFFVRSLKDGVRPIAQLEQIVSPADGNVITAGLVTSCNVEQIKGVTYTVHTFLGEASWCHRLNGQNTISDNYSENSSHKNSSSANRFNNNILDKRSLTSKIDNSNLRTRCHLNSQNPVSSQFEVVMSSSLLSEEVNTVVRSNNWMMGWLIFYFRFCIADLLKNSIYIGVQLIYSMRSTNILINDKVLNGASKKQNRTSLSEPEIFNNNLDTTNGELTALCDPYWDEYKKKLLHKQDNQLYQLVVYLAPGDYHRFHSPVDWNVKFRRHFQGELLSVNPTISKWIPELFSLNERAVYVGEWKHGFFSMTAVGATNVGSIRVYRDKELQTNTRKWRNGNRFQDQNLSVSWKKGEEIGQFRLGSTIVLLFEGPKDLQFSVKPGDRIQVGQAIINHLQ